jgi:hypothetical protein
MYRRYPDKIIKSYGALLKKTDTHAILASVD